LKHIHFLGICGTAMGAVAAGMSVFSYLEKRVTDQSMAKLSPYYDQCELLP